MSAASEKYVSIIELKPHLSGRESEILDKLGIDARAGKPRIRCPYPGHDDKTPSWRWDETTARAFCSCSNEDILGVVQKMLGCDFQGACLLIAETLGLTELIRSPASRRQKHDAVSLLNPDIDNRDDEFAWRYLAHRLGVKVDRVPRPATLVVGHKTLAYFDPPSKASGKPILVGDFPCAVFETVDPQGKRQSHAHRIYLAADGRGKAALGTRPDGSERDCKKSAKKKNGENIAGLCVIWGVIGAQSWIIAEGIETACAIALAFADEIAGSDLAVASAIYAGGIAAVRLPPLVRHICIAADRDENGAHADEFGPGEKAARSFCALNSTALVSASIALPGRSGEDVDWLNILNHHGIEAIRTGIASAVVYQGGPEDQEGSEDESVPNGFRITDKGVEKSTEDGSGGYRWTLICSPLHIAAETRDENGYSWGRLLTFKDRDGRQHDWSMPMSLLASEGAEYRGELLSMGLEISHGRVAREALHEYISRARPSVKARCVPHMGWCRGRFVLPDCVIGPDTGEKILLQSDERIDHAFNVAGTLESWQEHIARYAIGNSRLEFSIAVAFAAALVGVMGAESGGYHLAGFSSIGKTTALHVAGSVWGGGRKPRGYMEQWRATENALEGVAAAHSDALLCLDELSQIDPKEAGAAAYMLANRQGKHRANRKGGARIPVSWNITFLSSGEITLADKLNEDGRVRKITGGQQVRVFDIPADPAKDPGARGETFGIFENLHGFGSPDKFADHLTATAGEHYGAAARAFIEKVAGDLAETKTIVSSRVAEFKSTYVSKLKSVHCRPPDGQVSRAAGRFGLVAAAAELAIALGVLRWHPGSASVAVGRCFMAWVEKRGGIEAREIIGGIEAVRDFITRHGSSRFEPWGGGVVVPNRAGWREQSDGWHHYFTAEGWREATSGFPATDVARTMVERGLLVTDNDGKSSRRLTPHGHHRFRLYHVPPSALDTDADAGKDSRNA